MHLSPAAEEGAIRLLHAARHRATATSDARGKDGASPPALPLNRPFFQRVGVPA